MTLMNERTATAKMRGQAETHGTSLSLSRPRFASFALPSKKEKEKKKKQTQAHPSNATFVGLMGWLVESVIGCVCGKWKVFA